MKDIKIIVATHKEYQMPEDKIYMPLHVGGKGKKDLGYQKDDNGKKNHLTLKFINILVEKPEESE